MLLFFCIFSNKLDLCCVYSADIYQCHCKDKYGKIFTNNDYGGDILLYVFIGCLAFGVFYSALSLILGGHGDHGSGEGIDLDHGVDIGHDVDFGHGLDTGLDADIGGGLEIGDGGADIGSGADVQHGADTSDSADSPSPFSPLVMAGAITTFGAVGLISMEGFGLDGLISTFIALGFAGAIGAALFFGIVKFMYGSQSNSVFSLDDTVGTEADVITPIPESGLGEIAFVANGTRYTLSARSMEGTVINRGKTVIIRDVQNNVAVVQQKMTIDDIEL